MRCALLIAVGAVAGLALPLESWGQQFKPAGTQRGDQMLADYFRAETARLTHDCLDEVKTLEDWTSRREEYRKQLLEMLGLDPLPEKTDLKPVVTGKVEHDEFTVEKLYFQSRPGLYVTGNLYVPKELKNRAPAILYVCGHGNEKKNGVSYGSKSVYQHHGGWFARNGYVCLIIDTLQLGEIEGLHHGTYREGMWWWLCRGYTPAGVEAWNCVRALDYLQSRPEVDGERIGVTGRSGGGAYSWWIAAIDERIKAAVPVAGITDLHNHVVDGTVEGHCDCMFMVNTYQWDYAQVAAMVAPRPLLISNTDKDRIFPLEGVVRVHEKVRNIYRLYGAADKLGLQITEGPHKDTQELHLHAFVWFDRYLKGENKPIDDIAVKFFAPEQLKVFDENPRDEQNTRIQEVFTVKADEPKAPDSSGDWQAERDGWRKALEVKSFRGWPKQPGPLNLKQSFTAVHDGVRLTAYDFTSQEQVPLRLYVAHREGLERPELVVLNALDDQGWSEFLATMCVGFEEELRDEALPDADAQAFDETKQMFQSFKWAMAYIAPRGVGPTAWNPDAKKQVQVRRRFMLLGQSLDAMQTYDLRRAVQALRTVDSLKNAPLWLQGQRQMAGACVYASLFEPDIKRLDLWQLPKSQRDGPYYLNVLRYLDMPQAVAMAAERSQVRIYDDQPDNWKYPGEVAKKLGWDANQVQIRKAMPQAAE
jgi:cephalosporin-C deacetylase-like acetyl esterase